MERKSGISFESETELGAKFFELAQQWKRETRSLSLMSDIVAHPAYRQIVEMGLDAVPFLLNDLQQESSFWFSALREITGENPIKSEDKGRVEKMRQAWLDWGREHGYL